MAVSRPSLFGHSHTIPHDFSKLFVEGINTHGPFYRHQLFKLILYLLFRFIKFRYIRFEPGRINFIGQVILDGVGQYKIAIGKSLHQG